MWQRRLRLWLLQIKVSLVMKRLTTTLSPMSRTHGYLSLTRHVTQFDSLRLSGVTTSPSAIPFVKNKAVTLLKRCFYLMQAVDATVLIKFIKLMKLLETLSIIWFHCQIPDTVPSCGKFSWWQYDASLANFVYLNGIPFVMWFVKMYPQF